MTRNDLEEGLEVTSAEMDRTGDGPRTDPVASHGDSTRTSSLSGRLPPADVVPPSVRAVRIAGVFVAVGVGCLATGFVAPAGQQVLFALGGIGLFAGALVYGLASDRVIDAGDGERVYGACADNLEAIVTALGAADERVYVPDPAVGARLLVPIGAESRFWETTDGGPVDPRGRGLVLRATGSELYEEFERASTEPVADSPELLSEQLIDALRRRFELVTDADPVVRVDDGRATIAVSDSPFGPVDRFDHPVASFLAVGFAAGLGREVSLEVSAATDSGVWLVSCQWDTETTS